MKRTVLLLIGCMLNFNTQTQKNPAGSFYDLGTPFHFSSYYQYPYTYPAINRYRTNFWIYNRPNL